MSEQSDDFLLPWKDIADIDDFLAEQIDKTVRCVRSKFEQKQEWYTRAKDILDFRLGVVVRKKLIANKTGEISLYIRLDFGLLTPSSRMDRYRYSKASALLREALREAENIQPMLDRVKIRSR